MFGSRGRKWFQTTVIVLAVAAASLLFVRWAALKFQQNRLKCIVRDTSYILHHEKLDYWWDFGTLLGLIREGDIIWTEVDADISVTLEARNKIWNDPKIHQRLAEFGIVEITRRDDPHKLRMYDSWGFVLDMDVWEIVKGENSDGSLPYSDSNPSGDRVQMTTGRQDSSIYNVPVEWIFPMKQIQIPAISSHSCDDGSYSSASPRPAEVTVAVPQEYEKLLKHWYGDTWRVPRKFDKGIDISEDPVELFFWKYAMFPYEIFLSLKIFVRAASWGLYFHRSGFVAYILSVALGVVVVQFTFDSSRDRKQVTIARSVLGLWLLFFMYYYGFMAFLFVVLTLLVVFFVFRAAKRSSFHSGYERLSSEV